MDFIWTVFWIAVAALVLAYLFVPKFRQAVVRRFRGEAVAAAEKLKAPLKDLALAEAQYEQQSNKLEKSAIELETNRKTVLRKVGALQEKRAQYEKAAQSWGAQGNREKVAQCVEKMEELDAEIAPLVARLASLETKIEQTQKLRVTINSAITRAKNKRAELGDRLVTAQMVADVNKELSSVDISSASSLIEDAEAIVAAEEDRAEAYSDLAFEQTLAANKEDDLLAINQPGDPSFDSKVDSYLKPNVPLT